MKKIAYTLTMIAIAAMATAQKATVSSPDGQLKVSVDVVGGQAKYNVTYNGAQMLKDSPLGFEANTGNCKTGIEYVGEETKDVKVEYQLDRIKTSNVSHEAKEMIVHLKTSDMSYDVRFHVSNNDIAFRYELPKTGETGSVRIMSEATGFAFPEQTTTFMCPQSEAMIGWKRTKPSYEEEYAADAPMESASKFGKGYTFPCLFHVGDNGWVLISETGVDSHYCGSHLSDYQGDGLYTIAFPMPEENNGNGTVEPAFALPGATPWRTITVGSDLRPIVETTIAFDVVEPLYKSENTYRYGKGTWSWILWQDGSINYEDQTKYVDLASAMGFQYVLVDNWWDLNIGEEKIEKLVEYARAKNVEVFLWYSSSGYWNDIVQGPINRMDNSIVRKQQMRWMKKIGVKGIKVDFFGGDKQETIRLYEQILSDADDNGLMVIFHGCTLPRGWEKMYPNYVGSEAVLASENLIFDQHFCDYEGFNTTLHPFIRNAVGCMEFGGSFMNKRMHRSNQDGNIRRTTDIFEIATSVLFQNPIQNFALAPNNLEDAPRICLDFLRDVPTTWDETIYIDGYPGKYVALARRHQDKWYIAIVNGTEKTINLELDLSRFIKEKETVTIYNDDKNRMPVMNEMKIKAPQKTKLSVLSNGGIVITK